MISLNKVLMFLIIECLLVFSAFIAFREYTVDRYPSKKIEAVIAVNDEVTLESSALQLKNIPEDSKIFLDILTALKDQRQQAEAIHWCKELLTKNPPPQEAWYATWLIAECYQKLGNTDKAIEWALKANQHTPDRAEPLFSLASHLRQKGFNHSAYMFAKAAKKIPRPSADAFHLVEAVYDYQLNEEIYLSARDTKYHEEGFTALNELLLRNKTPDAAREMAYRSLVPYVQSLKGAYFRKLGLNPPSLNEGSPLKFNLANATITKTDEGYDVICRTVNYRNHGGFYAFVNPTDRIVRTKNVYAKLDKNLNVLEQKEVVESLPRKKFITAPVEGLEDCRIFKIKGETWFSCTTTDTNPLGPAQVSLGKLSDVKKDGTIDVEKLQPLSGPDPKRVEKNWLPLVVNDELYMIYSYDPFIVYKTDLSNGHCEKVVDYVLGSNFTRFRGSAAPILFDGGYLILVHEVIRPDTFYFFHRFIYTDYDLVVKKISKPFYFHHKGVEYSCGMTMDHSGNSLLIPVSREDSDAYIATINLDTVRSLLEPLPKIE